MGVIETSIGVFFDQPVFVSVHSMGVLKISRVGGFF
jgi:hypothetical protein